MYTDDDIFLAPESIISGVLASEALSDPIELDLDEVSYDDWAAAPELD